MVGERRRPATRRGLRYEREADWSRDHITGGLNSVLEQRFQLPKRPLELLRIPTFDNPKMKNAPLPRRSEDEPWTIGHIVRKHTTAPPTYKNTYRDALLSPAPPAISHLHSPLRSLPSFGRPSFAGKCLRCLGRDHRVSTCRDPIWCRRCFKLGHFARYCMNQLPMNVYRAMRARPTYLSAFVPLSEDFFARQKRRHNAVVVDMASPANLGHFPRTPLHSASPTVLGDTHRISMSPATANETSSSSCQNRTIAALVGGFSHFIRADDFSTHMVDLTGYRYLVAVNHLHDIPEDIEISFGDLSTSVLIQLER
uniref:CCHC-type domain-containing protein n=1 Tax=Ananas comosus var. bracteatus TaxID=296719 RepID=A0A6V7QKA7_ANACO|nr:unnamed protein product [Ananas comosus var. bracteatus]